MSFIPNILLAGPHPDHLLFLEQLVSSFQVQTLKAMSGSDAISILEQNECALAIMEVNMPDMDGYELVKQIRQVTHIGHVPVILIMDDYSDSQYFIESIENGLVDFITKPVIPMIVQSKVKIYLELYKQGLQLQTEIENRKQAESVLFQTEKDLAREKMKVENTDRLKSVFLSNMAHELRTPLNSIIGFSNLLKDKDITPELRITYSNYIHISGQSLLSQVNEIIDFSKLDADQLGISGHPVNVNEVIYELFKLYKTELNNRNKTQAEPEKGPLAQHSPAHDKIVFRSKNMEIPVNKKNELDRKQILVAEDEEINFYFLKEALRNDHVTIYWARNG